MGGGFLSVTSHFGRHTDPEMEISHTQWVYVSNFLNHQLGVLQPLSSVGKDFEDLNSCGKIRWVEIPILGTAFLELAGVAPGRLGLD